MSGDGWPASSLLVYRVNFSIFIEKNLFKYNNMEVGPLAPKLTMIVQIFIEAWLQFGQGLTMIKIVLNPRYFHNSVSSQ